MKQRIWIVAAVLAAGLFAGSMQSIAQPVLTFTRIVNNWPTIELYFKVACDGQPAYPTSKQFYEIYENGLQIDEFTLWCPDPRQRCAISVAMVFDASGSMSGAGNAGAKAAGNAFVDLMDGIVDEAAVIWFTSSVNIELGMTTNRTDLHDAVNSLPANGGTAIWDGIYVGLQELIVSGSNPCRAVIAMTDGNDNSSVHTPDEIIALANRNRIRVYTIGLGTVSPAQLETIALLTGGRFYQAPSASVLVSIYEEISTIIFGGFLECIATYQARCMDGGTRVVDLKLTDYCHGGTDQKTRTYRAPKDTSTYAPVDIELGDVATFPFQQVEVPVRLRQPFGVQQILYPSRFVVEYDPSVLTFSGVHAPQGTALNGVPISATQQGSPIIVDVQERALIENETVLCYLRFTAQQTLDTTLTHVRFNSWMFEAGCLKPVLHDGLVFVYDGTQLYVISEDQRKLCEGETLDLKAADGFTDYRWNTGWNGQTLTVSNPGQYFVTAELGGIRDTSQTITVVEIPKPVVSISPLRDTTLCDGQTLDIQATPGFSAYEWSTGETTESITVDSAGTYFVRVQNSEGCWGYSTNLAVNVVPAPQPVINGRDKICGGATSYTYSVPSVPGITSQWSVANGSIVGSSSSDSVTVVWAPGMTTGSIQVNQVNIGSSCTGQASLDVQMTTIVTALSITKDTTICRGSTLRLSALNGYDSYIWSTGEQTSEIFITNEGDYYVEMSLDGCTAVSDTIHVTVIDNLTTTVSGETTVCQNDITQYSATEYQNANYIWEVVGGSIVLGQGTSAINVKWDIAGGGLYVYVITSVGGCIATDTLRVNVESVAPPAVSYADSTICDGESMTLTAPAGYATYAWSTGETTQEITVDQAGTYTVTVETPGGCTATSAPINIVVLPAPPKPSISQSGDVLTCSVTAANYVWYKDGVIIPGENNQTLVITADGTYEVVAVGANGCRTFSDAMAFTGIGRYAPGLASSFDLSPNPSNGVFTVQLQFEKPTAFSYRLVNVAGQEIYHSKPVGATVDYRETVQLPSAPTGVYFFIVESAGAYDFQKLVIR